MAAGLKQHGGVDAIEGGVTKSCGEVVVGGFAVARARLPDESGGTVLQVGEECLLQAGVWVAFDVVGGGGSTVLAEELFGALGHW